uniref:PPARG related coactivator 1 n=1 Tax=Malurus cyaneus samueli TaxID=2593467 RepID=A0A8C5TDN6_9PASS
MFEVLGVLSPCLQLRLSGALVCCEEISAGGGVVQSVYVAPHALQQCFSLEEDDLNLTSLDAETILEAEEILGTMQNYLDSSVISIIEDLSLSESKVCLDAQNELSLLTAITEILDSTDDETLSPFDTIMDAELLTSPRERENPSVSCGKFLTLSRPLLECESPTLEPPKALRPLSSSSSSSSSSVLGDFSPRLPSWHRHPFPIRKVGWHRAREQPLPQRSDGEEEEEEAALSLELDSSMEAVDFCVSEAGMALEEHEDPCIINTGDVSLSELVKSMHPYCLPTFTVCLDPDTEPVARELLSSSVLLEIVPGEGESVEIPVVLKPLTPSSLDLEPQLLSAEESTRESIPEDRGELPGAPAQENGMEEEKEEKLPGKEPSCTTPEGTSPPEAAAPGALGPNCSSWHSTEAPASGKRECSEKGRGRERARKSRKKKAGEDQRKQARPGRDCVAHRLRSAGSGQPQVLPATSRLRAACPSVQVSDFLAQQLERARKEGQMELHAEQALRPWGRRRSTAGPFLPKKVKQELQKEPAPETVSVALEKNKTLVPLEKTTPSMEGQPTATCSSLTDETEGQGDAQSSAEQTSDVLEAASQLPEQSVGLEPALSLPAAEPSEGLPKESKPKALSLREYRIRMLHRQLSEGGSQEGKKQVASKWPSVPEPPTELAEIPCLVSPMPPTALTAAPAPSTAPAPATAPPTPSTPMPFVAPNVPPAAGVAPTGMPPASAGAYALYPPVPSWPCFSPQPMGCHSLPPPPSASSSNTFHMVPGLPPPGGLSCISPFPRYRSRCSHSSSSRSSCGSCGRSRDRSSSSSSTSSYSSRSTSRSQSRSPSPRRRSNRWRRGPAPEWGHPCPQEERRVVFIGKIPSRMTRSELRHRFSVFGDIEECTLHFRSEGDNYGFVTYRYAEEAFAAIESGHKLRRPDEQPFDLCFGGRRQFCRRNYADLDSNREDFDPAPVKSKFDSLDFDTLLRQAQRSLRR